jgi:hypothetical protein
LEKETLEPTMDIETKDPPALQIGRSEEDPNIDQEGKFMIRFRDQILSDFDFDIEYIKSKENVVANALSRRPLATG